MALIKEVKGKSNPAVHFVDIQDMKIGDLLLLDYGKTTRVVTVEDVKTDEVHGIEVVYDKKKNLYFNLTKYRAIDSEIASIYILSYDSE
jgi:hypothetical protein